MRNCMFSLRLVDADFTLEKPILDLDDLHSSFRDSKTDRVPVIRLFGSTSVGQKTCLHVHGVYPYLYVIAPKSKNDTNSTLLKRMAAEIDLALHVSLGKQPSNLPRYVHNIEIVNGRQFYGYHQDEEQFCKIYFYNPLFIKRLADIFLNGSILGISFQPHEAHIPYMLQFFMDFNLYGMNFVHLQNIKFRRPIIQDYWCIQNDVQVQNTSVYHSNFNNSDGHHNLSNDSKMSSPNQTQTSFIASSQVWSDNCISSALWLDEKITRQSTCSLEADVHCSAILNQHSINANIGKNPGLIAIWEDEKERRRLKGNSSQIAAASSQDRPNMNLVFDTERNYLDLLINLIESRHMDESSDQGSSNEDVPFNIIGSGLTGSQLSQHIHSQALSNSFDQSLVDALASLNGSQSGLSISDTQNSSQHNGISIIEETAIETDESDNEDGDSFIMSQTLDNLMQNLSPTNSRFEEKNNFSPDHNPLDGINKNDQRENSSPVENNGNSIHIVDGHYVLSKESISEECNNTITSSLRISQLDGNDDSTSSSGSLSGDASIPLPRKKRRETKARKALQFQDSKPKKTLSITNVKEKLNSAPSSAQQTFSCDNLPPLLNVKVVCKNRKRKRIGMLDITGSPLSLQSASVKTNEKSENSNNDRALFSQFEDQISYSPLKDKLSHKIDVGSTPQTSGKQCFGINNKSNRLNKKRVRFADVDKRKQYKRAGKSSVLENEPTIDMQDGTEETVSTTENNVTASTCNIFTISPFRLPNDRSETIHEDVLHHLSPISPLKHRQLMTSPPLPISPSASSKAKNKTEEDKMLILNATISSAPTGSHTGNYYMEDRNDCLKQNNPKCAAISNPTVKHLDDELQNPDHSNGEFVDTNINNLKSPKTHIVPSEIANYSHLSNSNQLPFCSSVKGNMMESHCLQYEDGNVEGSNKASYNDWDMKIVPQLSNSSSSEMNISVEQSHDCSLKSIIIESQYSNTMALNAKSSDGLDCDNPSNVDDSCSQSSTSGSADIYSSIECKPFLDVIPDKNLTKSLYMAVRDTSIGQSCSDDVASEETACPLSSRSSPVRKDDKPPCEDFYGETSPQSQASIAKLHIIISNKHLGDDFACEMDSNVVNKQITSTPKLKNSSETHCDSVEPLSHSDTIYETIVDQIMASEDDKTPLMVESKSKKSFIIPLIAPPSHQDAMVELRAHNELVAVRYQKPFCSIANDVQKSRSVGGRLLKVGCKVTKDLPSFESGSPFNDYLKKLKKSCHSINLSLIDELEFQQARDLMLSLHHVVITPVRLPPSTDMAKQWLKSSLQNLNYKSKGTAVSINQGSAVEHSQQNKDSYSEPLSESSPSSFQELHSTPEKKILKPEIIQLETPGLSPVTISQNEDIGDRSSTTPKREFTHPKSLLIKKQNTNTKKRSIVQRNLSLVRQRSRPLLTDSSQIDGPTPKNTCGFNISKQDIEGSKAVHELQFLTILSLELHIKTRSDNNPDPTIDPLIALVYHLVHDSNNADVKTKETGLYILTKSSSDVQSNDSTITNSNLNLLNRAGITGIRVSEFSDEKAMLLEFARFITYHDPDILLGYEIQMLSWGYLVQRAGHLDINIIPVLSRIPNSKGNTMKVDTEEETFLFGSARDITIAGRIVLNIWRIMRSEVTLNIYTFENVAFHVLHERFPKFPFRTLTDWWNESSPLNLSKVVSYYTDRCCGNYRLLESVDFFGRTSELARLFGILFYSVISRGSQYRVESMMLRIAKPMSYIAVSPNVQQRARMAAPECIPLVMEPESRLYVDPVIVLDFQSLYPSIMIAYNYCFSTCLGRVSGLAESGGFIFGTTSLNVPVKVMKKLMAMNGITVSPNGVAFVKDEIRKGVLPSMLKEILETRIMVKTSMKQNKDMKSLYRLLDARQLGLKLIANVTYGYTSANFSGRMPSVEIADSIVRKARETLERAITLVNETEKWGARVVYGDTDSLFILVKGASKQRAFDVAKEIMAAVTQQNPKPIKLKFEKVYLPCVLQTKKRYVGYMYESVDQLTPIFDAKGIETVRRDGCPAVSKMLERSLRLLFETKDVSLIKRYVQRQFKKISEGSVSLQDFIIAKEYRGMKNYKPAACVPALELARKAVARDKRSEPRVGERVPYLVINGPPGVPLIQLVRKPLQVMKDPSLRLNSLYYITKQIIPPLNRFLLLIGVDAHLWFADLPRISRVSLPNQKQSTNRGTISQYFSTLNCIVCSELTKSEVCENCAKNSQMVCVTLAQRLKNLEKSWDCLCKICSHCTETFQGFQRCCSLDCPVKHKLYKVTMQINNQDRVRDVLSSFLNIKDIEDVVTV